MFRCKPRPHLDERGVVEPAAARERGIRLERDAVLAAVAHDVLVLVVQVQLDLRARGSNDVSRKDLRKSWRFQRRISKLGSPQSTVLTADLAF